MKLGTTSTPVSRAARARATVRSDDLVPGAPMKRLPLLLPLLLAACVAPPEERLPPSIFSVFQGPAAEPAAPEPLPPQVLAALPPGVPPSIVVRNVDGCYIVAIEVTDPPSGYPLRDASGRPVCDGAPVLLAAPVEAAIARPVPEGMPVLPPGGIEVGPLVPGDITPPAPIAPLGEG